ncbi:uncharacterized protein LOC129582324 isoform X2 [Paramacrobiotus metropolitanus]|uniref:uncharacterized protein LOC129582324 isoform X2 n=1 Tax=Paramacrobiotus metropolitanus TaxID=2943436 RepID=UPI002445C006|nr:uncharacterized protein LOC129582324 isoform X2 [Paramacrobiotus metropolitanus]
MMVITGVLLLVASVTWAQTTTTTSTTTPTTSAQPLTPPNCDCGDQDQSDKMQASSGFGWFHRRPMMPHNKTICGTNGQTYANQCLFINAQAQDDSLGMRPCFNDTADNSWSSKMEQWNEDRDGWGRGRGRFAGRYQMMQKSFCMSDGSTFNGTMTDKQQYLQQNPNVGVRCHGSCPCQLQCPQPRGYIQEFILFLWR